MNETKPMNTLRGKHLTVICILAWVNSAILLILSLSTLLSLKTFSDSLALALESRKGDTLYEGLWIYIENIQNYGYILYILYIICATLSAYAVYLIWNKKRIGLYLYLFFIFLPPVASLILHLKSSGIVIGIIGVQIFISIAFSLAFFMRIKEIRE